MRIAIVSNISEAKGLARDFELLRDFLTVRGHEVIGYQHDEVPKELPRFDLALFLEVIPRAYLGLADTKFWFVNLEWVKDGALELAQKYFQSVFTKTREAQRILEPLIPGKTHYVGFLCRDQYDATVPRYPKFLHLGGNASLRGSRQVLDAFTWKRNGKFLDAELTIVSKTIKDVEPPINVTLLEEVSEEELKRLQNSHFFHIYPSGTEGYGHAIHEAQSVGAHVITTDAPPMNELQDATLIPWTSKRKYNMADVYDVTALDVYRAVEDLASGGMWACTNGRLHFEKGNLAFAHAFEEHLDLTKLARPAAPAVVVRKNAGERKAVAFLGNFRAPESTENQILWALTQRLDMEVIQLQEDATSLCDLRKEIAGDYDYFLWVRTPGWLKVSDKDMFAFLMDISVPSISVHLDKFWGIPEREKLIGVHPFWQCDHVFTADGSRTDEEWESRGVNHHWMKPAVSEVYCHPGTPREEFKCDVMFCGAREYHGEYAFRAQMVDFLQETYGDRFKHVTGVRGHLLNDAYASAKVIVADCFAAGIPRYWSDRAPETCGRYGYLLHPAVKGFDIPTPLYRAQDLNDLEFQIEKALREEDKDRKRYARYAADGVRLYDTWTVRLREILSTVDEWKSNSNKSN